jgi:hypothetical protein
MLRNVSYRSLCAAIATVAVSIAAVGCSSSSSTPTQHSIRHVFMITLENKNYSDTFSTNSAAPYLSQTLVAQGALLTQYYGTGHVSLDNYTSMMSGQAPTPQTDNDCTVYADLSQTGTADDGQVVGTGCVYPATVKTFPDQLVAAGYTWRGYMGDMGNDPTRESATCGHPTLNTQDLTQTAEAPSAAVPDGDSYATRHDPFMYFHSITDSADCAKNVVNLNSNLQQDLASISTTANFNFITPNLCDDGHDAPCANGQPGGLASINVFLQKWIPIIEASPAYKKDGLIIINFDESNYGVVTSGGGSTTLTFTGATCCNEQPGPNLASFPQTVSYGTVPGYGILSISKQSFGGDQTGAVLISPFILPGSVSNMPYNHYSLLKSLEDIFQVDGYLGYAGQTGLVGLGSDVFTGLKTQ